MSKAIAKSGCGKVHTGTLAKSPTGVQGLDEITDGGLPRGRPTLICGGAGCGKTLLATEFLVRGASEFGEPGVFVAFEETAAELAENVRSLGFDLEDLVGKRQLVIDHIHLEPGEIEETGEYDLEGLFVRLGYAIDSIGAKRVVLDTLEVLFGGLRDSGILRSELRRLFRWLKDRGITAIITAERGEGSLTRYGLEEYVSDCVVALDHRVSEQLSTRRLRIVKYRGSTHGTNEFPFLIDAAGISVLPITSIGLDHKVSNERVSTGVPSLDAMLGDKGFFRGSSILVSGTAGTGKTSIAAHFARACCERGERCLYFAFEESREQLARNMRSIGLDLDALIERNLLRIHNVRSSLYGLEMHLVVLHKLVEAFQPDCVVIDPISDFVASGSPLEVKGMLTRVVDYLKNHGATALFTSLTPGGMADETSGVSISSVIDTWLLVRETEVGEQRQRELFVLKSRGMAHSHGICRFVIADSGIELALVKSSGSRAAAEGGRARRSESDSRGSARKMLNSGADAKKTGHPRRPKRRPA